MRIFVTGPEGTGQTFLRQVLNLQRGVNAVGDSLPHHRPPQWFEIENAVMTDAVVFCHRPEREAVYSAWCRFTSKRRIDVLQMVWNYRAAMAWRAIAASSRKIIDVDYDLICADLPKVLHEVTGLNNPVVLPIHASVREWSRDHSFVDWYNEVIASGA